MHNVEMRDFDRDYQFCEGVTEIIIFLNPKRGCLKDLKEKMGR